MAEEFGSYVITIEDVLENKRNKKKPYVDRWFVSLSAPKTKLSRAISDWEWECGRAANHRNAYGPTGVTVCKLWKAKVQQDGSLYVGPRAEPLKVWLSSEMAGGQNG